VVNQIDQSMGSPSTCPHGNVIPGRSSPYGELVALADLLPGSAATVRRISEVAEHEAPALLAMLADHAIREGSEVNVAGSNGVIGDVAITVAGKPLTLSVKAAQLIWVEVV
jgi:DtxR family transcriptional regulator, Mn-dependent transcriptional regulator